jgi:hypothetical protein
MGRRWVWVCAAVGLMGSAALGRPLPNNVIYYNGIPTLLDTDANDLVADYGSFNPSAFIQINNSVKAGYSSVPTTGVGIYSTHGQTTTNPTTGKGGTILAIFDNDLVGVTDWPIDSGHTVSPYCVIGKYTFIGDSNFDGQITPTDFTAVDANLGTTPPSGGGWLFGDMNLDGIVTPADYTYIALNLGYGVSDPWAPLALGAVPEPGGLALIGVAGVGVCRRRRAR